MLQSDCLSDLHNPSENLWISSAVAKMSTNNGIINDAYVNTEDDGRSQKEKEVGEEEVITVIPVEDGNVTPDVKLRFKGNTFNSIREKRLKRANWSLVALERDKLKKSREAFAQQWDISG
ncbi:unnamed protein product [Chrysodeixis includens]|uniref:Uncharacterized protein n=1 Tax=Chrysodeixis includens TaxID=689277 RepID=A0A9N8Q0D9_CHRIL|nr:unnamed protein product [Chrysodeixis includens]